MQGLSEILDRLVSFARKSDLVAGVILMGSMARKTVTPTSDIDLAFILSKGGPSGPDLVKHTIDGVLALFYGNLRFHCLLSGPTKLALFLGEPYTKVDLFIIQDVAEVSLYLPWDLPLDRFILLDKSGTLQQDLVTRKPPSAGDASTKAKNAAEQFNAEIDKVLYAFEATSLNYARRDNYRFYFEYNIALHRLVRLICIARGFPDETFLPPDLGPRMLSAAERAVFQELQGEMNLFHARDLLQRFMAFFFTLLDTEQGRFKLRHSISSIREFCDNILHRDFKSGD